MMAPAHGFFRAKGCLVDLLVRRTAGDTTEVEHFDAGRIAGAEECADIVEAPDIFQNDAKRKLGEAVCGGSVSCLEGNPFHRVSKRQAKAPAPPRLSYNGKLLQTTGRPDTL